MDKLQKLDFSVPSPPLAGGKIPQKVIEFRKSLPAYGGLGKQDFLEKKLIRYSRDVRPDFYGLRACSTTGTSPILAPFPLDIPPTRNPKNLYFYVFALGKH